MALSRFEFLKEAFLREWRTLVRFGFVGGTSFLVKVGCYALLSRILWVEGSRSLENVLALLVAIIYNYALHRLWTFRHLPMASGTFVRYSMVVVLASVLEASMFYVLHERFGFYDLFVLVFDTFLIAFLTFFLHRLFTFHDDPWKRGREKSLSNS